MKRLPAAFLVLLLIGAFLFAWWKITLAPTNPYDTQSRPFVITQGDGVRDIAKKLRDQGLIRDQVSFFLLVKRLGIEKNIQAGSYQLSPAMPVHEIAQKLTVGTEDLWITVPEGWRSEEILEYLGEQGFNVQAANWQNDEGHLFPDTYLIPKKDSAEKLRVLFTKTFAQKADGVSGEALIMASLIEREARKESDRPLVASVLMNRLQAGMALDVDATVQYALGKPGNWWKKDLTVDDLKVKSPYNTYLNPGLPPGPIANPGLSAIKAAQNPAQTDYLFYLTDKQGTMHYAKTLQEHNANVAKYLQ